MSDFNQERFEADTRALLSTVAGRDWLQQLLAYAGVFDAPGHVETNELWLRQGARGLALDVATIAGAMPEVPGSRVVVEPQRHGQALDGRPAPDAGDDEERADG